MDRSSMIISSNTNMNNKNMNVNSGSGNIIEEEEKNINLDLYLVTGTTGMNNIPSTNDLFTAGSKRKTINFTHSKLDQCD